MSVQAGLLSLLYGQVVSLYTVRCHDVVHLSYRISILRGLAVQLVVHLLSVDCFSKLDFCKDVKNLVDVGAILPYYVTLINVLLTMSCEGAKSSASLAFLRVTRL